MIKDLLFLGTGLIFLLLGSHWLVKSLKGISIYFRLKPLFLSIVVLGFVSSAPEAFVTLNASFKDFSAVAMGNIIGSNIINVLLILSLSGLFCGLKKSEQILRFDMPVLIASAVLLGLVVIDKGLELWDGILLLFFFAGYLFLLFKKRKQEKQSQQALSTSFSVSKALIFLLAGFGLLFIGSSFTVDSSIALVKALSLSEKFAGVFILSLSTSLPELATTLQAGLKKEQEMALGNIIGSNLFNTLFVLGSASLINAMPFLDFYGDYFFMCAIYALLFIGLLKFKKIPKAVFILFILAYVAYISIVSTR